MRYPSTTLITKHAEKREMQIAKVPRQCDAFQDGEYSTGMERVEAG